MTTWYMHTLGRADYNDHYPALANMTASWADIDGWHHGPTPETAPTATHLWAWDDDSAARLRVDGTEAVAAILSTSPSHPTATRSTQVTVRTDTPMGWGIEERRIKAELSQQLRAKWQLLTVVDDLTITFVRRISDETAR
jgi:hypothetical protein